MRGEEIIHYELLKVEGCYSEIVDLIASIKCCKDINRVDMFAISKGVRKNYSLQELLDIPLLR